MCEQSDRVTDTLLPEGGTKPHASAYYRLEGLRCPRMTRSVDLSQEYPGLSIFVDFWGLDTSSLDDPGADTPDYEPCLTGQCMKAVTLEEACEALTELLSFCPISETRCRLKERMRRRVRL